MGLPYIGGVIPFNSRTVYWWAIMQHFNQALMCLQGQTHSSLRTQGATLPSDPEEEVSAVLGPRNAWLVCLLCQAGCSLSGMQPIEVSMS